MIVVDASFPALVSASLDFAGAQIIHDIAVCFSSALMPSTMSPESLPDWRSAPHVPQPAPARGASTTRIGNICCPLSGVCQPSVLGQRLLQPTLVILARSPNAQAVSHAAA